jgi:hypothetical protein
VRTTSSHDRWTEAADRLVGEFDEEFRLVAADTEPLREASFALWHDVYCRELGFEPVRADGLERDAYDDRALQARATARSFSRGSVATPCVAVGLRPRARAPRGSRRR